MKKILIVVFIIASLFTGALFWIDSKIDKDEISNLIIKQVESSLVGTKAQILDIKYNLGFSLSFELSKLSIIDRKTKDLLVNIDQASINMNILSVLFSSGKIDIEINSPTLNLSKDKDGAINLKKYMSPTSKVSSNLKSKKTESTGQVDIPRFIEKSSLNFSLKNLVVNLKDKKVSTFKVDKILIKDLGFNKTTAYEVESSIIYNLDKVNSVAFKAHLFGEVSLKELLANKSFNFNTYLHLKDINSTYLKTNIPNVETKIVFVLDENSNIKSSIQSKSKGLLTLDLDVKSLKEELFISIKNINLSLANINELIQAQELNLSKSILSLKGEINSNFSFSKFDSDLKMALSKPVEISYMADKATIDNFSLNLVKETLTVESSGQLLQGKFKVSSQTKLDILNPPSSPQALDRISSSLSLENVIIPDKWLAINSNEEETKKTNKKLSSVSKNEKKEIKLPVTDTYVVIKNLKLGKSIVNSKAKVQTFSNKLFSKHMNFNIDESNTNASFEVRLLEKTDVKFNLKSKKLNLLSFKSFLPKNLEQISGIVDLNTSGRLIISDQLNYVVSGDLRARDGSLKGLNLKDIVTSFVGKLSKYLPKKKLKVSEEYDRLNLNFKATPSMLNLNDLLIVGKNKSLDLRLKGNISTGANQSKLVGSLLVRDLLKDVKKLSSDGRLPLLLKGEGYALKPSTSYTTSKLVKSRTKKEFKKVKSKFEKKAKDFLKGFGL